MSQVYFNLAGGSLTQDWSNIGQITTNDDWSGVPSIEGYLGQDITTGTGTDPQTLTGDSTVANDLDVIANQSNPNGVATGGVAEFDGIANPTVALQGSGTADAPYVKLFLNATGRQDVRIQFNARDIDGSTDNAIQQLNVQFRVGESGPWTNVPSGYFSDLTTGPSSATQVTAVNLVLPAAANNAAQLQVRVMTTNAVGNDEWVGIDDIVISSNPLADITPPTLTQTDPTDEAVNVAVDSNIVMTFNEDVQLGSGDIVISDGAGDTRTITVGGAPDPDGTVQVSGNTVTINPTADLDDATTYHVTVAAGAIEDTNGNDFAGIPANGLDFTTLDENDTIGGILILDQAQSLQGFQGATPSTAPTGTGTINLVRLGEFTPAGAIPNGSNAEVVTFDPASQKMFILNTNGNRIDIVKINSDGSLTESGFINLTSLTGFGGGNSVAVKNGILAVAYANAVGDQPGFVALFDTAGNLQKTIPVGVLPDMVTFTPDGSKILVANEAEAVSSTNNPFGSISIIDVSDGAVAATVTNTISFASLNDSETALRERGLAIFTGQDAAADIEPEYISVSPDGTRAYVTLQEVNGVAVIDLTDPAADRPISILPLGTVDHNLAGNEFDPSDQDGINLRNFDVLGLLQPDAIASFEVGGVTYFITANEGDSRVGDGITDSIRVNSNNYTLDLTEYPNRTALEGNTQLGRLNVLTDLGNTDGDAEYEQIYTLGGRGISIFKQNPDGSIVKVRETGGEFEKIVAALAPSIFNQNNDAPGTDVRSDDKGPEPEGVDIGVINGRTYAFVALERTGGVMIYDVTDPANAAFVGFKPPAANGGGPEVAKFISAATSPTGTALVLTANEVGGTTTVYAALPANFTETVQIATNSLTVARPEGDSGTTTFSFVVERTGGTLGTVNFSVELNSAAANASDFAGVAALPKTITGTIAAGASSATITVAVQGDAVVEPNEAFTVTLKTATLSLTDATGASVPGATAAINSSQNTGTGTILNDDVTHHIYDIQGSGHFSLLEGEVVTTQGVVTAVDTNGSRGFYIQDPNGDGNSATSDGIFVFLGSSGTLPEVGHRVSVTGTVTEFTPSGAAVGSFSTTEISSVTNVTDLGVGPTITPTQIGGPGGLVPPTQSLIAGSAFFEKLEGMLVTVKNAQAVGPTNDFGEIFTVVDNDANAANGTTATGQIARGNMLITPGSSDFGDINTGGGDFNPERVQIDDDNGVLAGFVSPDVNVGARLGDVTGIVNYDFGNYQVVATQAYTVSQPSTLVKETGTLAGDARHLLVASYNAENLDPGDGAPRFATIASEILNNLRAPDVVALQEVQDNNGPTDNGVTSANVTLQTLVDAINAAAPAGVHYAFIDNPFIGDDSNGGEPGGNIRTAFLYRTDRVDFVESSLRTIAANGAAISNPDENAPGGNGDQQDNPDNPFFASRPPLVASFVFNGQEVTVVNNHFTSKGGSAPLLGFDQPPFNAGEVQRAAQAQAVNSFVDSLLASNGNAKVIVAGDLNEHPWEEPIQVLKGTATISNYSVPGGDPFDAFADFTPGGTAVLSDLQDKLPADQRFDYVFEGNSQTLDHVLVTAALEDSAQFDVVRINAEFADQTSDHDPLLASFDITYTLQLLHFSDAEAGLLASDTAPDLAALVDAFDDDFANTLILAGGDDFLPGPFLAAGTDSTVIPALNAATGSAIAANAAVPFGAADIGIHNIIGVEASTIGNHEFDLGSRVFRDAFSPNLGAAGWVGAQFPYLSANLDFSGDADLVGRFTNTLDGGTGTLVPEASTLKGRIAPSAVITKGGEKIGLVAATTQLLEQISSPTGTEVKGFPGGPGGNGEVDDMDLLASQLQPVIDELRAEGINKIVLMAHLQQISNEKLLATKLHGVDIILSAGSNTRLGDADDQAVAFPGHSASFDDTYPLQVTNADGKTTLIVNTDGEFTYLGRLVVDFDANGDIVLDKLNSSINGAYAATDQNVAEAWNTTVANLETTAFANGTKGDKVRDLTDAVQDVITVKDGNVFGFTDVYLEGERQIIRTQETNLGDLSADANTFAAREALGAGAIIVSLKNGGGIRAQIGTVSDPDPVDGHIDKLPPAANPDSGKPEGGVSQLDVENSLRFDNKLMVFDTTPQGLLNLLNHGAGLPLPNGGFPQIGGVRFSYDPDLPVGQRVINVALIDENDNVIAHVVENGVVVPGAPATISIVTLNFTANGGDGYPAKANGDNFRYLLTDGSLSAPISEALDFTAAANVPANALGEQRAFGDYMSEFHATPETAFDEADTPISQDIRIQNLNFRNDEVFLDNNDAPVIVGDLSIVVPEGQSVVITTTDLNEADPDHSGADLTYTVTGTSRGDVLLNGVVATTFTQVDLDAGLVSFRQDGSQVADASFTVTLTDAGGLTSAPSTVVASVTLEAGPGPQPTEGDFNGDSLGDLFLFKDSGEAAIWLMNGNQRLGDGANLPNNGPTWHAKAFADFDPTGGSSDILWQNDSGALAIWQMNGTAIVTETNLPNPGAAAHVVGADDFDGNGGADVLLKNDSGQLSLLLMDDSAHVRAGGQIIIGQNPGAPWDAITGDFNGDGKAGVLFHDANGNIALWEDFVETGPGQGEFNGQANLPSIGASGHVRVTGDFDGDSKDDILWQNDSGQVTIWLMDGLNIKQVDTIAGTDANGPTWHIVDARDMDGDGKSGIIWQNDSGATAIWEGFASGAPGSGSFAMQLNVAPSPNPGGHLDWHVL